MGAFRVWWCGWANSSEVRRAPMGTANRGGNYTLPSHAIKRADLQPMGALCQILGLETQEARSLMLVARWLGVDEPLAARPRYPLAFEKSAGLQGETREVEIPPDSAAVGACVADLGLPAGVLVLLIRRGNGFLVPRGQTRIEAFDTLLMIAKPEELQAARERLLAPPAATAAVAAPATTPSGTPGQEPAPRAQ